MKSIWFKRFEKDLKKLDPHLRLVRLKYGFYRIFWKDHFLGECYEEMPQKGYDIVAYDPRLESQSYYEEYEDHVKMVRTIKNFVEGYWDSIKNIKTRLWMVKHNEEFHRRSRNIYNQVYVK